MLGAIDQTAVIVAGFTTLGILVSTIGGVLIAKAARQASAAERASESVGAANGHGSLQDQMKEFRSRQQRDEADHQAGIARQLDIQQTVLSVQALLISMQQAVAEHSTWQVTHSAEDVQSFGLLREAVDHLRALVGEPDDSMDPTPLITYLHKFKHDMVGEQAKLKMAGDLSIAQVLATLEEAQRTLEEIRAERHLT